jgi:hypothetical protein
MAISSRSHKAWDGKHITKQSAPGRGAIGTTVTGTTWHGVRYADHYSSGGMRVARSYENRDLFGKSDWRRSK